MVDCHFTNTHNSHSTIKQRLDDGKTALVTGNQVSFVIKKDRECRHYALRWYGEGKSNEKAKRSNKETFVVWVAKIMISILAQLFSKMNFASLARFSNCLPCSLILFSFVVVPASGVENGQFSAFTFSH